MIYATLQLSNTEYSTEYDARVGLPYPVALSEEGEVIGTGPAVKGDFLIGFKHSGHRQNIDVFAASWLENKYPEEVVGLYPVFSDGEGFYSLTIPVMSASFYKEDAQVLT